MLDRLQALVLLCTSSAIAMRTQMSSLMEQDMFRTVRGGVMFHRFEGSLDLSFGTSANFTTAIGHAKDEGYAEAQKSFVQIWPSITNPTSNPVSPLSAQWVEVENNAFDPSEP